ncbi:MAG: HD domain-containing protein [candidate division Zixibacteria bacterium]|nr:HD domain-containing protein [candidate division Zixibacteria bacterium]
MLDSLRVDSILDFDLYIEVDTQQILYRSADLPFTDRTRQSLMDNKVERLFITNTNRARYQRYIECNLPKILTDPSVREEKKANILYDASTNLVQDVLENPTYGENIQRSSELVTSTVGYILQGRDAFLNLMAISSFDYYTYTHSVNVCTFSVALAQQLGCKDEQSLNQLGVGALLHDIGKSKVPDRILHKRAPLNNTEFEIMKKHPQWGTDLLAESDHLAPTSHYPVLQHHERGEGQGYPNGLKLSEMHFYSQIVAICDTFDAMTTVRVYQGAIDTFPALRTMFAMQGAYNEKILRAFAALMGPTGLADV